MTASWVLIWILLGWQPAAAPERGATPLPALELPAVGSGAVDLEQLLKQENRIERSV